MSASPNRSAQKEMQEARKCLVRVYRKSIGYQPLRMKAVHFATSFLLCLSGHFRKLELLNKAANPRAIEKTVGDEYVTSNLIETLAEREPKILGASILEQDLVLLRNHLHAAYNNDGAALAPAFRPYSTFGYDFSTPSPVYLANASKNHGHAGALVWTLLNATPTGQKFLSIAREIFHRSCPPSAAIGMPFVDDTEEVFVGAEEVLSDEFPVSAVVDIANLMQNQTSALLQLAQNIQQFDPAYSLRQLIIGTGSWLLLYMIKRSSGEDALLFSDFSAGARQRVRIQARACYARHISNFGQIVSRLVADKEIMVSEEERQALSSFYAETSNELEEHFNDFSVRIGWVQPRAANVKQKHFEAVPDTLKVLLHSIIAPSEVLTMDEIANRLFSSWGICLGLVPSDHSRLHSHGYSPLDHDADLRANRECFKRLAVDLDIAREPSDGLVLFSLQPQTIF